jgi:hypothetical protein
LLRVAGALVRPVLAAGAMAAVVATPGLIDTGSHLADLVIGVCLGGAVYAITLVGLWLAAGRPEGAESEAMLLLSRFGRQKPAEQPIT